MKEDRIDGEGAGRTDDLSPTLRRAVNGILRDPPPDDVTCRALAAARQVRVLAPVEGSGHRRKASRLLGVLAIAAALGLVAASAWWHWGGRPNQQANVGPPQHGPDNVRPTAPERGAGEGDRLPSLWAYRQAARVSTDALDVMLDHDAHRVLRPDKQPFAAGTSLDGLRQTL